MRRLGEMLKATPKATGTKVRENKVSVAKAVRQVEHAKPCERPASRHHRPVISSLYHARICALD